MNPTMRLLIVGLLAAGLFGGCHHKPIEPDYESTASYGKVTFSDTELHKKLVLGDPVVSRTESGLLKVSQPVRETERRSFWIEYRFIWLTESGQPIRPQMGWRTKRLESAQPDYLTGSATSEAATDYRLEIRRADRP